MRRPTAALPSLLLVLACGGREVSVPTTPLIYDGGPWRPVPFTIVDVSDPEDLANCYAPEMVMLADGGMIENCATECPRGPSCEGACANYSSECPSVDGAPGVRGACDKDMAKVLRSVGYEVPKWPMKRCDRSQ